MAQPSSGTYAFQPALSDLVIEAYSRIQIRPTSFTTQHMTDARMSANLLLTEFAVRPGPNLWEIELIQIPLTQGTASYAVPQNIVAIYDYYIRQFQFSGAVSLTPTFSTVINTTTATVTYANFGLVPGNWVNILVPVAVGGIVIYGFYEVQTVLNPNQFTITLAAAVYGAGLDQCGRPGAQWRLHRGQRDRCEQLHDLGDLRGRFERDSLREWRPGPDRATIDREPDRSRDPAD